MPAPEWKSGNEPEYSRADLHELDAELCGDAAMAAPRPALCDLISFAHRFRDAAENVVIAHGMGWDMEATVKVLADVLWPDGIQKAE